MPVYLRRWYLQRLSKAYEEESEAVEKAQRKPSKPNFPKIKKWLSVYLYVNPNI